MEENKEFSISRISMAGPNFGSTSMYERKTLEAFGRNNNQPLYDNIRTADDELPIPVIHGGKENVVEEIDGNINVLNTIITKTEILCCHYSEDYKYIISGSTDGVVSLYDSNNKSLTYKFFDEDITKARMSVTSIKYRPVNNGHPQTNSVTCTYADGIIKCWNYMFNKCIYTIREKRQTLGLSYHIRAPKFVTFGDDCRLNVYDEETRTLERILGSSDSNINDGHTSRIFAAHFDSRSNNVLISAGWDDVIQFWDTRLPKPFRRIEGPHVCGEGLELIPFKNQILTCSWRKDNQIQLWDFGSGKLITEIEPDIFQSNLYCGKVMNRKFIITGGTDPNILRLIDMQSNLTISNIRNLPGGVYNMDVGSVRKEKNISSFAETPETQLPRIIFCSGFKIYEIDFGL